METMTYSQCRAHYAETLGSVLDDREEVVITRAGREPGVIVFLTDYESLTEKASLLQNPANARRLLTSIERLEGGQRAERDCSSEVRLGQGRVGGLRPWAGPGLGCAPTQQRPAPRHCTRRWRRHSSQGDRQA